MSLRCEVNHTMSTPTQSHVTCHYQLFIVFRVSFIVYLELYATITSWHHLMVQDVLAEIINIFTGKKKEVQHVKMDGDLSQRSG